MKTQQEQKPGMGIFRGQKQKKNLKIYLVIKHDLQLFVIEVSQPEG
jgi:hypothetical protein